jgi:hypothetical protein
LHKKEVSGKGTDFLFLNPSSKQLKLTSQKKLFLFLDFILKLFSEELLDAHGKEFLS